MKILKPEFLLLFKMDLILVLGAQGVGKTTVVKKAIEKAGKDYQVLNFGSVLQEVIGGADRDEFRRKTSVEKYWGIQEATAKEVKERAEGDLIVTSHGVLRKEAGWYPGFPKNVLEILEPRMIVVLTAKPKNIIKRRKKGGTRGRTRDKTPREIVKEEQESTKIISFAYSMYTGATVKIIENKEGKIDKAAKELSQGFKNL